MTKVRILVDSESPHWTTTYIFINDKYKNNIESFEHNFTVGDIARLDMVFLNKGGGKYKRTFLEGIDNIKYSMYNKKLVWKEILPMLR